MIGWLDCASGVSGDKLLAALIDAGADADTVTTALDTLGLDGWEIRLERVERGGVSALHVDVASADRQPHRSWREIREMFEALDPATRGLATHAFALLAEAEARVHGRTPDDVVFHEVGAVDSIVDIVGCCAAFALLGQPELVCSPVALGGGTVSAAHGQLPVPAPATALLIEGVPAFGGPPEHGELTTPTGAALVRTLAGGFGPMPPMSTLGVGHGAGSRDIPGLPNVLRLFLGESVPTGDADEVVALLETNVDHVAPELLAIAIDRILHEGALDAWTTPIVMKKGRAALAVSVMCRPADADRLATSLREQTGTLGVRVRHSSRWVAERETLVVDGSHGRVRLKRGAGLTRPEADDVARVARETGEAPADVARRLGESGDRPPGE